MPVLAPSGRSPPLTDASALLPAPAPVTMQGCPKAPVTGKIAGYFEVFTGCKLAGISEKKLLISIMIKNRAKKSGLKLSIVSLMAWMYFVMHDLQKNFPLTLLARAVMYKMQIRRL